MKNTRADIIDLEAKVDSEEYPTLLKEIPDPPEVLFIKIKRGVSFNPGRSLAVVGTRKATRAGCDLAFKTAFELGARGFTIVSGLAMGIDSAAHKGALSARAKTIAVMAGGLDNVYPPQNEALAKEVLASGGALISEHPPGTPPYRHHFLARNRIISGLSIATIVVEAPKVSGAINTARLAAEQGREAFVFPGSADQLNYSGSNSLIRDGARLVSSAEDIMDDLGVEYEKPEAADNPESRFNSEPERIIYKILKEAGEPLSIDKIIEETKLQPQTASTAIATLMVKRIIKEERGRYFV